MAYTAGVAFVQVLPSVRGWNTKIRAEIKSSFPNGLTIDVTPKFDAGTVRAQAAAAAKGAGQTVEFKPDLDTARARAEAEAASRSMGKTVKFKVDLDRSSLSDSVKGIGLLSSGLRTIAIPAALLAITPAVVSLTGSLVQAAGAAWLLPAGLVAGGAAAATLKVGLSGVGDTLKALSKADDAAATTATASGKARAAAAESVRSAQEGLASAQRNADRTSIQGAAQVADARRSLADAQISGARQVAAAQQDLTRAQEQARAAQQDLTRAWKEGQEQLEDFALTLRGAALDEEDAVDRLEEARARLESARAGGAGAEEIDDLSRAVRRAELGVDLAAERMGDLREEQQEWARTGVAGSDAVVSAQRRVADSAQGVRDAEVGLFHARQDQRKQVEDAQRSLSQAVQQAGWAQADATRQVTDAQRQLATAMAATGEAGSAAAATAAAEMAKLSPAAQALVGSIRSLGPAWTALRLDVQERLLAGIGDRVTALAGSYLPILRTSLGGIATGFNDAFKQTSGFLETPGAVNDIALGMNNVTLGVNNASGAMRPLTQLFVDLFAVGSTFLPAMGAGFATAAQGWADFIARARETGQLKIWIQQGIDVLKQLWSIVGNVGSILSSAFGSANASGESFLSMLDRLTGKAAAALKTPEGAGGLTSFFVGIRTVTGLFVEKLVQLWPVLVAAGGAFVGLLVAASPFSSVLFNLVTFALVPLLHVIEFLAPVLGPMAVAIGAISLAVKIWGAAQWLLNAALTANPIGIVIVLIAGLVGALIWAWKNSETFRNIVMGAWEGIKLAVSLGWAFIKPVFDLLGAGISWLGAHWKWFAVVFLIMLGPIGIIIAAFTFFRDQTMGALRAVGDFFVWVWKTVIKPTWDAFGAGIRAVYDYVIQPAFNALQGGLNVLQGWFWNIVDGIGRKWNELRGALSRPINFMIETVFNNGILRAWNKVREWLPGLPEVHRIAPIAEFARGSEDHRAQIARPGAMRLWAEPETGGEAYIPLAPSKRPRSTGILRTVADEFGFDLASRNDIGRFAAGGLVAFGRRIQGMGYDVAGHSAFGGRPTSGHGRTSLHYTDQAIDVNAGAGTSRAEQDKLGRIIPMSKEYGLRSIFMSAGHFNHAHFDTGGGRNILGAIGGAIGGAADFISTFFRDAVGGAFRGITDPLLNLLPTPPPQFAGIPREQFTKIRDAALAFVLGKADEKDREAGAGGVGMGPLGKGAPFYVKEIARAGDAAGVGRPGKVIGVATSLVETMLKMYANRKVPASLGFPHDAVGSDHDSVGLFQQRQAGWGTLAQRMNPFASAQLFFNALNRFNWRAMAPGPAAQKVQRSAFPGRYAGQMGRAGQLVDLHADKGGMMPPGFGTYFNGTGKMEPVLTDEQWQVVRDRTTGGDGTIQNFYVQETTNPESTAQKIARRQAFASRLR